MATKPIPEGYHTVSPYLAVEDATRAIEYYTKALGAKEVVHMDAPDGKIGHAELGSGTRGSCSRIRFRSPRRGRRTSWAGPA